MIDIIAASSAPLGSYGGVVIVASGFLVLSAALRLIWKKIIVPLARIDGAVPTLIKIADEFKEDGGNSLRNCINKIQDQQGVIEKRIDVIDGKIEDLEKTSERVDRYIDSYLSNRQNLGPRDTDDWFTGMSVRAKEVEF